MVDDTSRFMWVTLQATKDAAADDVKKIKAEAEKGSGHTLKVLRTDNGGEFTVAEFADYCAGEGVRHHFSAPHLPQQNSVVERRNQTVVTTARAAEVEEDADQVLGGSSRDCGSPAQPLPNEELAGQDPLLGLAAIGGPPQGVRLHRLRQGPGPATEAGRPRQARRLHRLHRRAKVPDP